ncbi:1448_t:CDS:2 [Dentiscutata erythropus]|uniref:1448_t:CDS:1 n=1 Tax=Dentiscutata erythropus TaxID=1348616 RepID=A0A9N9J4F1_9GLOM|nr:1448_t:CDS:2 [Dentiscutata erythropus]
MGETDRDSPKEKESQCFRIFRMSCLFIVYGLIIAYIVYYLLSFSGPSLLQMSRSVGDVPVPAVIFVPGSSPINNISCVDTTVTYDCSNNIQNYTDYFVYLSNFSFSKTYNQINFSDFLSGGSISLASSKTTSNIQNKLSSLLCENLYTLSPFQVNYILLERIQYQDLDTSLEKDMFTKVASKSSQHRVKYFGLSTKILSLGQYSNADFLNGPTPYTYLQISNMSTILTTYTQVNKVSSTTVVGFLSGLGSTAFLLTLYKFCFGGYKAPGLLKRVLPKEWTMRLRIKRLRLQDYDRYLNDYL